MTVNRLTDEKVSKEVILNRIRCLESLKKLSTEQEFKQGFGYEYGIAQELLTLRKENATLRETLDFRNSVHEVMEKEIKLLRKRVEVGDTIANHLEVILEDFDGEPHDAYTYKQDIKKWRESGVE